jgi:hypothetical protein
MVLVKTHQEIRSLVTKISLELRGLPDYNTLDESNDEAKQEMRDTITQLQRAMSGSVVSELEYPEEYRWLYGTGWSALEDYE